MSLHSEWSGPSIVQLEHAYRAENTDREWAWFKIPARLAPYQANIYPLLKKDELTKPALDLYVKFKQAGMSVLFDKNGAIGKRYARADEIGTPYSVTVDYDVIEKDPQLLLFGTETQWIRSACP